MIAVARLIREHPAAVARTLRETFAVGLSDLGDRLTWGVAKLLLEQAAGDGGTVLGAELAGWAYPASTRDLIGLMAHIGDQAAARKVMPWALEVPKREQPASAEQIAVADAQLEAEFIFA